MEDKKKPVNGTFTQVPNVFLDTCDLPETAQIMYLRLLREFGYRRGRFVGSIRKLSKLVRLSKSTTDRLSKKLRDAGLINIEYGIEEQMTITVNIDEMWALNKHHYEVEASQIWDSKMPSVPILGQSVPPEGQGASNLGQNVPETGQNVPSDELKTGDNTNKTSNTFEEMEEVDPSSDQNPSEERPKITGWLHMLMRKFLIETETYSQKEEHLVYLQEVFYASGLDQASFRVEVESAIKEAKKSKDMRYFYDCLCSALYLEQVN